MSEQQAGKTTQPAAAPTSKGLGGVPRGTASPVVSVVVPTRNRARLLREVIEALFEQEFDPQAFELIVVDNLSTDGTEALVSDLAARAPFRVRYRRMPVDRGPVYSRNEGAAMAEGEVIAFTDSDCRPGRDWLREALRPFADATVGLVSGPVLYKPGQPVRFFSRASGEARKEHPTYPTANALYRRGVFLALGGFDTRLTFRSFRNRPVECADSDLALRLIEAGHGNVFVPEAVVYHEVERLPPVSWAMEPFRLFVVPALVRRHPVLRRRLLTWRIFFQRENAWFYLAVLAAASAGFTHWSALAGVLPFVGWASRAGNPRLGWRDLPKMAARTMLLAARHACMCAGLVYGSLRFRSLVL